MRLIGLASFVIEAAKHARPVFELVRFPALAFDNAAGQLPLVWLRCRRHQDAAYKDPLRGSTVVVLRAGRRFDAPYTCRKHPVAYPRRPGRSGQLKASPCKAVVSDID